MPAPEIIAPGQAPAADAGQAPIEPTPSTTPTPPTGGETPEAAIARLQKEVKAANAEAAKHRVALKAKEDAELSELQKAQKDLAELTTAREADRAAIRQTRLESAAIKASGKLGIVDPDLAALAVASAVEFDDNGNPTNVEALLTEFVKTRPYLVGKPAGVTAGSPANPPGGGTPSVTRDQLARMSRAEIDKLPKEVVDHALSGK